MSRPPTPKLTPAHLADIGLFGGLSNETLETLASSLPTSRIEAGAMVVEEGDLSTQMFVVIAGELEVVKKGESGGDVRVAVLGPGDWFGEMSIIDVQPRSASVRAVAPTLVLSVTAEHVENLLYRHDVQRLRALHHEHRSRAQPAPSRRRRDPRPVLRRPFPSIRPRASTLMSRWARARAAAAWSAL